MIFKKDSLFAIIGLSVILLAYPIHAEDPNFLYPKKKPASSNVKTIKTNISEKNSIDALIPKQKSETNAKNIFQSLIEKKETFYNINIPPPKPSATKKEINTETVVVENNKEEKNTIPAKEKNNVNLVEKVEEKSQKEEFLLPVKKPLNFIPSSSKALVKSEILNEKDFKLAKEIFELVKKGNWNSALPMVSKVSDREFRDYVNWLYLLQPGNQSTFTDYINFISRNEDYPRIGRLKYLAEHKIIVKNAGPRLVIDWFSQNEPLSGTGKIKFGEAYLELGNSNMAKDLIKSGWETADLSSSDVKYYISKFKNILTTQDHLKRADYLAWDRQYWDLKRMLPYLPKKERALYNARFILMTNSYGVDKAISDVPDEFKSDLGLEYNRLYWRTRRNRLEGSLEILRRYHGEETLVYPDKWWDLRENIARDLVYEKKYADAYEVASNHHLYEGANYADAEWLSGWLALSFLNNPKKAIVHFSNFYSNVSYPISAARGAYWLGLAFEANNDIEQSKKFFKEAAIYTNTYYGQLAFAKVKIDEKLELPKEFKIEENYEKEFNKNKFIKIVKLMHELDKTEFSKDIIKFLALLNVEKGSEVLAAKLATEVGRYDYAIQISKDASYERRFINVYNYPVISVPGVINNKVMPPAHLILAIIRQESEFDARANSYVGAQGLMQLMPATAKLVAKNISVPYSRTSLTKDPNYNVKLGTYYFNMLLEDYDGVFPFAIGAYNAGPNRIKAWLKRYGDPNRGQINFVDWVELIRFEETRNYVQRVIENINVYKVVLNEPEVRLDSIFKR
ncbi:MAG: transglycosylase SLT domain-containing protein [Pelagibacteraceae bacterium]